MFNVQIFTLKIKSGIYYLSTELPEWFSFTANSDLPSETAKHISMLLNLRQINTLILFYFFQPLSTVKYQYLKNQKGAHQTTNQCSQHI